MNDRSRKTASLSLSFGLPVLVIVAVFAAEGICPFGSRTLGVMDMDHQYIAFLYSLRDILSGEASLFYLPSMCLGGNMAGLAAYYLMSPLDILTCLFSRENMYLAVSLLYFLRVGLLGLSMCVYCGRRHGYGLRCIVAALSFALMSYMLAYSFNYLWQDSIILLPLIALGIARLREGKRPGLYVITLALALVFCFYIGYMLCLFSVLFFLLELLSVPRSERKNTGKLLLRFALSSLAAGALAAVVLLPAFLGLSTGKAEFSLASLALTLRCTLPELLSKLLPGSFAYEQIMPEGLPSIFCGTVTVVLAILYLADRGIPRRRRLLSGGLLLLLTVSMLVTALDLIWHCLNTPNWYNARYSFLFCFLLAALADRELVSIGKAPAKKRLLLPPVILAAVALFVFVGRTYEHVTRVSGLAAVVIAAALCLLLWLMGRPGTKKRALCLLCAAVLLLHTGELGVNAGLSLASLTAQTTAPSYYAEYVTAKAAAFDAVPDTGELLRTESPESFRMDRCEAMLFGYDGISHYGSTISQSSLDFLDRLGFDRYTDLWALYGNGVTSAAETILGVRYTVASANPKNRTVLADTGDYFVCENENALPLAWTADNAFGEAIGDTDCFTYTNALYHRAAPELSADVFTPAILENVSLENLSADGSTYTRLGDGSVSITYTLTAAADGDLYGELELEDFPGVMVFVNGAFSTSYAVTQTNGSLYLGSFRAGDAVTVKIQGASDLTLSRAAFATENADTLKAYADALRLGGCPLQKLSDAHYTGEFTTGEGDGILVLTIPYDGAWRVILDGVEVEPFEVQDCLMAVAVTPGTHTIELRYIPAGFVLGAVVSGATLTLCIILCIYRKKRNGFPT